MSNEPKAQRDAERSSFEVFLNRVRRLTPESVLRRLQTDRLRRRYASGNRDFTRMQLHQANLLGMHLAGADFSEANLLGAYLTSANLQWCSFRKARLTMAWLTEAQLTDADLTDAHLGYSQLVGTVFDRSLLTKAVFTGADLLGSSLRSANLTMASFLEANLASADLTDANLSGAEFHGANLRRVQLTGANLGDVGLGNTEIIETDLAPFCDAVPPIRHDRPSHVDFRSIMLSATSPNIKGFLVRTGMPEVFAQYMVDCARSLNADVFKMLQSTFVSYGAPDEPFARKLYEALHRNGVSTFLFSEHAEPGEKLHRMMRKGVNEHDRVILICSRASLDRNGVLNELEEILAREARDGGASYLIPIRLDDYVFTDWKPPRPDLAQAVRDRVVADFIGADSDDSKFQAGLQKLIRALRKRIPAVPPDSDDGHTQGAAGA